MTGDQWSGAVRYGDWRPSKEELYDDVSAPPFERLAATLGVDPPALEKGSPLPPLWHWLMFLPNPRREDTGRDGHPERGGFLPPLPHQRRMFAGGRLTFFAPIRLGVRVRRRGEVVAVEEKTGSSGRLVVVTVRYEISDEDRPLVAEEQDLVYTDTPPVVRTAPPNQRPPEAPWSETIVTDEVMLFRFSALTYNGHRIHYDRSFATATEGYPDLVTHGPLTAILIGEMIRRNESRPISAISFRASAPLFVGEAIHLRGSPPRDGEIKVGGYRSDGVIALEVRATVG